MFSDGLHSMASLNTWAWPPSSCRSSLKGHQCHLYYGFRLALAHPHLSNVQANGDLGSSVTPFPLPPHNPFISSPVPSLHSISCASDTPFLPPPPLSPGLYLAPCFCSCSISHSPLIIISLFHFLFLFILLRSSVRI